MTLEHLTLTSGASRMSPRSEVSDSALDAVRGFLAAGGTIGSTGWHIRFEPLGIEGGYMYDMLFEGQPVVTCLLCTDPRADKIMWDSAMLLPNVTGAIVHKPKATPWLAAYLRLDHPGIANPAEFADVLHEAGDLERVVAWALID